MPTAYRRHQANNLSTARPTSSVKRPHRITTHFSSITIVFPLQSRATNPCRDTMTADACVRRENVCLEPAYDPFSCFEQAPGLPAFHCLFIMPDSTLIGDEDANSWEPTGRLQLRSTRLTSQSSRKLLPAVVCQYLPSRSNRSFSFFCSNSTFFVAFMNVLVKTPRIFHQHSASPLK